MDELFVDYEARRPRQRCIALTLAVIANYLLAAFVVGAVLFLYWLGIVLDAPETPQDKWKTFSPIFLIGVPVAATLAFSAFSIQRRKRMIFSAALSMLTCFAGIFGIFIAVVPLVGCIFALVGGYTLTVLMRRSIVQLYAKEEFERD